MLEHEWKAFLAARGVAVPRGVFLPYRDGRVEVDGQASALRPPFAVKALGPAIVHKSDVGAVRLDLATPEAVRAAAEEMARALAVSAPDAALEGFSVQEMVRGEAEVIVGARCDPHFGPIAMVGLGGIAVEILKDVVVAPAPLSPDRARAMLAGLRMAPLLAGARGRPPLDVDAIGDALVRLSWLAADLGPRLIDLEVNPLIVRRAGMGAVAVDGRGTLADITKEES